MHTAQRRYRDVTATIPRQRRLDFLAHNVESVAAVI
jgi:hypothetical protein